jgi:signal transduction histidine kinase
MAIPKSRFTFRSRGMFIILGLVIGSSSLLFTFRLAHQIQLKEKFEVDRIWSYAMRKTGESPDADFLNAIIHANNSIPFIVVDQNLKYIVSNRIPGRILNDPRLFRKKLEKLASINVPLEIRSEENLWQDRNYYLLVYYDRSGIQKALYYFPLIQIGVIALFVVFSFMTFNSSKQNETNRIWIGMAKETAHQLGTPTSSLLGWVEYLRTQPVDPMAVDEMSKDLTRLLKVVDRFSKIGAETVFASKEITELVAGTVAYFRTRTPRNVELRYERPDTPQYALINDALFEWVIENLLKNALDALQGKGVITVSVYPEDQWLNIDVTDTGKGMTKANFKRIFEPGFTTKTRGWGLGLSLSARIIERYHKGKIYVVDSELNRGTTMRVSLLRG